MKPIRVGIVGCGVIAPTHAACYRKHDDVQLTWACDLNLDKARALAEKFEILQVTADVRQMLAAPDIDLVSICTDHASHAPIACAALEAGRHVLCEKALAHDTAGLDAMLKAGDAHPELVFAGIFQHRHEPLNQRIREMILDGTLGTLLTAGIQMRCWRGPEYYNADAWRGTWNQEGGAVLINQAIHYIDLLQWMAGGVRTVSGTYVNLAHQDCMETEDAATATLGFANGAVGTIEATCASHLDWEPSMQFHGTEGAIELRHDRPVKVTFRNPETEARVKAELDACTEETERLGKSYYGGGHGAQISDVLEAVRSGGKPYVTARAAAETVDLVLGIYAAHRDGRRVTLTPRLPAPAATA